MTYDRMNDFIDYAPTIKTDQEGLFPIEIHFAFNDKMNRWIYEFIDNNNWITSDFYEAIDDNATDMILKL